MAPMSFDTVPRFEILIERLRELEWQINGSG
jgi:hypothetical protein